MSEDIKSKADPFTGCLLLLVVTALSAVAFIAALKYLWLLIVFIWERV